MGTMMNLILGIAPYAVGMTAKNLFVQSVMAKARLMVRVTSKLHKNKAQSRADVIPPQFIY